MPERLPTTPTVEGIRPVSMLAREGVHSGFVQ